MFALLCLFVKNEDLPPGSWSQASRSHSLVGPVVLDGGRRFRMFSRDVSFALTCSWEEGSDPGRRLPTSPGESGPGTQAGSCDLALKRAPGGAGLFLRALFSRDEQALRSPLATPDTLEAQPPASPAGLGASHSDRCFQTLSKTPLLAPVSTTGGAEGRAADGVRGEGRPAPGTPTLPGSSDPSSVRGRPRKDETPPVIPTPWRVHGSQPPSLLTPFTFNGGQGRPRPGSSLEGTRP